ncbi:MAG: NAD-dependent epimerase [Omnitrophica bacterium RIFCSPHIGHO2_02_FULL_51_18]|nr:MAG: NAD-dependent epimerase [Omnitrophica bacterium RIFCSPHIGHO2_02_FULL_51_18]
MKILITGNMGYIGPAVVKRIRASYPKAKIVGLDTGFFAHCLTNSDVLPESRLDGQIFHDIRKVTEDHLKGVDAVVNLAAISNDIMGKIDESLTLDINYRAGVRLAKLAKRCGVKSFVFASSCSVYGFAEEGAKTEQSPVNPLTAYAKSKILTEKGLAPLAGKNFKVTCFRFATACGMSERLRLDLVINDFVACALTSKKITVLSDGTPWRPLIHIKDMARAMDWGIQRPVSAGGPFLVVNAGSDEWNYQVKDLAKAVADEIPGTEVSINLDAPPDKRSYRVDFGLFRKLAPKNQPQVGLLEAIRELKEGLEGMGFDNANFRDSNFMRIKVLMGLVDRGLLTPELRWLKK